MDRLEQKLEDAAARHPPLVLPRVRRRPGRDRAGDLLRDATAAAVTNPLAPSACFAPKAKRRPREDGSGVK